MKTTTDTQRTPEGELDRRFNLCMAHRRGIDLQSGELCEICTLLTHESALLAACGLGADWLETCRRTHDGITGISSCIATIRAVIAKAKGEHTSEPASPEQHQAPECTCHLVDELRHKSGCDLSTRDTDSIVAQVIDEIGRDQIVQAVLDGKGSEILSRMTSQTNQSLERVWDKIQEHEQRLERTIKYLASDVLIAMLAAPDEDEDRLMDDPDPDRDPPLVQTGPGGEYTKGYTPGENVDAQA